MKDYKALLFQEPLSKDAVEGHYVTIAEGDEVQQLFLEVGGKELVEAAGLIMSDIIGERLVKLLVNMGHTEQLNKLASDSVNWLTTHIGVSVTVPVETVSTDAQGNQAPAVASVVGIYYVADLEKSIGRLIGDFGLLLDRANQKVKGILPMSGSQFKSGNVIVFPKSTHHDEQYENDNRS